MAHGREGHGSAYLLWGLGPTSLHSPGRWPGRSLTPLPILALWQSHDLLCELQGGEEGLRIWVRLSEAQKGRFDCCLKKKKKKKKQLAAGVVMPPIILAFWRWRQEDC
jgi:hypothetical protein